MTRDRLEQCLTFISNFGVVIGEATPHLYLSGVALDRTILLDDSIFTGLTSVSASLSERHESLLLTIRGHEDTVNSAQFSPDGKMIVSASDDKTVRIWDSQTGLQFGAPLRGHDAFVKTVCFSPDGMKIASGSADSTVWVWDAQTGAPLGLPLCGHEGSVDTVLFSPDGTQIVSGSTDATIRVWNVQTGKATVLCGHSGGILAASFTSDGTCLVSASLDGRVHIWDDIPAGTYSVFQISRMKFGMVSVCLSADTTWLSYTVHDANRSTLGLVDRHTSAQRTSFGSDDHTYCSLALSPDATYWVFKLANDKDFRVQNTTRNSRSSDPFVGHEDSIESACFSADGMRIVSTSKDKTIRVWARGVPEQDEKQPTSRLSSTFREGGINDFFMSPDMSTISTFSSYLGDQRVWELRTQLSHRFGKQPNKVWTCAYSPDSAKIITTCRDKIARLWDAHTGEQVGSFQHSHRVLSASFSPDGTRVVSASNDIRIWDVRTGKQIRAPFSKHKEGFNDASFSPDGQRVVCVLRDDRTIVVWDTVSGAQIGEDMDSGEGDGKDWNALYHPVVFSPDGKAIIFLDSGRINVWDTQTQTRICTLSRQYGTLSSAIALNSISPDGRTVLHNPPGKDFYLWDLQANAQIGAPFSGHQSHISSVVFSPDGNLVVSASYDKTVRVWDVQTRAEVCSPLRGHKRRIYSALFSPDGKQIISEDGTVIIWDLNKYLRVPFTDTQASMLEHLPLTIYLKELLP